MSEFKSEPQVKIYDCFPFFNEIDILKIRIEELKDVVDKFVLVEANKTHSGKEKNLYFQELKNEFDVYKEQIVSYTVEDMPEIDHTLSIEQQRWPGEIYQRNCIYKALQQLQCNDNDIILISDVDEIPRADKISEAAKLILENNHDYVVFVQDLYYFNFNNLVSNWWCGTVACKYKQLKQFTANQIRLSDIPGTRCSYINSTRQLFTLTFLRVDGTLATLAVLSLSDIKFKVLLTVNRMIQP
jgi:beta-1,4-mannosyl-glycoprotein beta-1,4-N-acetylglucosaminyltransferase